ncbi:MAG TPA: zinc-dependent alcohol dehydrogenase [Candidatus Limnocylindrales bacterium]|nr:zinc-dependent alcohol dehydrogenase [Candidatus Limnocylindrales bacterium]
MRANCWYGTEKLRVEEVPDPHIINPRDAVVRITSTAICGSDLHLYDGFIPTMEAGDILGHEFMGEIVELGSGVKNRKVGDRVVCSFPISCGNCFFCKQELFSLCENSNPNAWMAEQMWGNSPCGIYGYSHMVGGYAGGQAQLVRVPFADVGTIVVPNGLTDDQVLFLSDILPTGYMAAEQGDIKPGDTVAVWGAGPVGLFSAKSAQVLGAERIIVIDRFEYRLRLARQHCNADTINYEQESVSEVLNAMTGGRGPDVCIDAVGLEGHMPGLAGLYDKVKTNLFQETDRPPSLRQAILCCRNGGTVSIPGVYGGLLDKMPIGSLINRSLKVRTGQTHVQHYWGKLLELIQNGTIDPTFIITHHLPLDQAPQGYKMFRDKQNECVKVVLRPN